MTAKILLTALDGAELLGIVTAASAQAVRDDATGLAVDPPPGYAARQTAASGPYAVAFDVKTTADRNTGCRVAFQPVSKNNTLSQADINAFTAKPEWSDLVRATLALVYEVRSIEPFEHAGVRGAAVVADFKSVPDASPHAAEVRTLLVMLETPKGRTTTVCVGARRDFDARRPGFEAVARGTTLPR